MKPSRTQWAFGTQEVHSPVPACTYHLKWFLLLKTIRIIFISTDIVIQEMCKSELSVNLSVTIVRSCSYASVCSQDKDLVLSSLDSLFCFPNEL